jgi:hypothetical protein
MTLATTEEQSLAVQTAEATAIIASYNEAQELANKGKEFASRNWNAKRFAIVPDLSDDLS